MDDVFTPADAMRADYFYEFHEVGNTDLMTPLAQVTKRVPIPHLATGTIVQLAINGSGKRYTVEKGRCCKNRSLQGVTFTRNGRGAASVNLGRNCVDSRYLAGRCARTNARAASLKGSIELGTGRSTTQG